MAANNMSNALKNSQPEVPFAQVGDDTIEAPRVPMRSQNLSPKQFSQDDFLGMETANMSIALGTHHWSKQHCAHAVVHPVTEKNWNTQPS
jgi:hypothetical protein